MKCSRETRSIPKGISDHFLNRQLHSCRDVFVVVSEVLVHYKPKTNHYDRDDREIIA